MPFFKSSDLVLGSVDFFVCTWFDLNLLSLIFFCWFVGLSLSSTTYLLSSFNDLRKYRSGVRACGLASALLASLAQA